MELDNIAFDRRFGLPNVKDGCGVFGMLRKSGSPMIPSSTAINGISCIKYRGSNLGAGYAAFLTDGKETGVSGNAPYRIQAFVAGEGVVEKIQAALEPHVGHVDSLGTRHIEGGASEIAVWEGHLLTQGSNSDAILEKAVDAVNESLFSDGFHGRIFSYGKYLTVYKEVGYPLEVAQMWGIDQKQSNEADMWIAHTRQPTNSPGSLPIWSHPFASMNTAIVHNGDISSYGSNMELLNSWGLKSHVGTDSEVIARLLDHLLRVEGLTIREAATVLTNPFERNLSAEVKNLLYKYRGARLDGPFAVVAGYADGTDTYLVALTDRSKFRPLLAGEDDHYFYLASEENQIRIQSPKAKIWTPEPGSFFIASLKQGLIEAGTDRDRGLQTSALNQSLSAPQTPALRKMDASAMGFKEINREISAAYSRSEEGVLIENCKGQRYLGIGFSTRAGTGRGRFKIQLTGFPGNCLANLNDGASFEVYGNVADDLADTMHAGSVVVHGSARDVTGQALQGGHIYIRGTVGNRAAIQMREYEGEPPFLIVGETADDYLGEYMAGGVVMVLNLSDSHKPARNYIGTGMVGGRIYIRGNVSEDQIGLLPQREDVLHYLYSQTLDGVVSKDAYQKIASADYPSVQLISNYLPREVVMRVLTLFFATKYTKPVLVERRRLDDKDMKVVGDRLRDFFGCFGLSDDLLAKVLGSTFTIIRPREEKVEGNVPPQETPIEE
ncbi:MAG: glutamate synthase [Thaumarchaeota archaeon]|nr:glutamate synthase [Nitrososphaerota archaeon]